VALSAPASREPFGVDPGEVGDDAGAPDVVAFLVQLEAALKGLLGAVEVAQRGDVVVGVSEVGFDGGLFGAGADAPE
jgi:hypothetical protein